MYNTTIASPSDIPELLPLINSAYRGEASRQGWTTEADFIAGDLRTDADDLARLMARPGAVFLVARDTAGPIGGCVFLEKRGARLYLGMLSVAPELQGQGIGKVLLRGADLYAQQAECQAIFMRVISLRVELIAWYERHGYRNTGATEPFESPEKFGVPVQPLEFVIL
ncbi:MAG: GNAT family N-acetyltransferase, partial [Saprospiraceae bacterium]|nr:GNAT family N-acetyltransferase [Saprospiraceae bacterium]